MVETAFLTGLEPHVIQARAADGLQPFREESWSKLSSLGMPTKSNEAFRSLRLRDLYASSFDVPQIEEVDKMAISHALLPECQHSHLVFVNGMFSSALSDMSALPPQTLVSSIQDAFATHGSFLQQQLKRQIQEEEDPFALLSLALERRGGLFYLPPKLCCSVPMQCLYVTTAQTASLMAPRLHLVVGVQSALRVAMTSLDLSSQPMHLKLPFIEISAEEGSKVEVQHFESASRHLSALRAQVKRDAHFSYLQVGVGGDLSRTSLRVYLKGEGAEAELHGLSLLEGASSSHVHATVIHAAAHTRSTQLFKGVLAGRSRFSFAGKIVVHPEAQKTEAYQLHKTLLLSPHALATSQPNLEIGADDVKASHGSTVAQLQEEALFYLRARGLDRKAAEGLLLRAFCADILARILDISLSQKITTQVDFLENGGF